MVFSVESAVLFDFGMSSAACSLVEGYAVQSSFILISSFFTTLLTFFYRKVADRMRFPIVRYLLTAISTYVQIQLSTFSEFLYFVLDEHFRVLELSSLNWGPHPFVGLPIYLGVCIPVSRRLFLPLLPLSLGLAVIDAFSLSQLFLLSYGLIQFC